MWLSLTFLVQDTEQKADKEREERKKKKIKQKDIAYEVTSEFFFSPPGIWPMFLVHEKNLSAILFSLK